VHHDLLEQVGSVLLEPLRELQDFRRQNLTVPEGHPQSVICNSRGDFQAVLVVICTFGLIPKVENRKKQWPSDPSPEIFRQTGSTVWH